MEHLFLCHIWYGRHAGRLSCSKKRVFCPWNAGTIVASGRKAFICPISLEFFLERKKVNYDITLKNA